MKYFEPTSRASKPVKVKAEKAPPVKWCIYDTTTEKIISDYLPYIKLVSTFNKLNASCPTRYKLKPDREK